MSRGPAFLEIVDELNADPRLVVDRYCAPEGAWRDAQGRWFCLSPMRQDRSVGSFYVNMTGQKAGHWHDHSTGEHGDMLDLIQAVDGCDKITALQTAKQLLGLTEMTAAKRQHLEHRRRFREREREADQRRRDEERTRREGWARALWHSARDIEGSPAARYLAGRGIDLAKLPRAPRSLRYHPACFHRMMDPETGEIIDDELPAMVAGIVARDGTIVGAHRTYLAIRPDGAVTKAPIPSAKKVLGSMRGAAIRLWSGIGPRGGKGAPLAKAPEGTRVYLAEGIEDGLSVIALRPAYRVLVAISLENMAQVQLPPSVGEVVICADNDASEQAQAQLQRALDAHARAGRKVFTVRNRWGGKDLNDALRAAGQRDAGNAA